MDKNFYQRLCTGIVFIAVLVSCITLSQWSFAGLFLLLIILGLLEFYKLIKETGAKPQTFLGVLLGASLFLFVFLQKSNIISFRQYWKVPIFNIVFYSISTFFYWTFQKERTAIFKYCLYHFRLALHCTSICFMEYYFI